MILLVMIYGLDWVATVPPTVVLCRQAFGEHATIVADVISLRLRHDPQPILTVQPTLPGPLIRG